MSIRRIALLACAVGLLAGCTAADGSAAGDRVTTTAPGPTSTSSASPRDTSNPTSSPASKNTTSPRDPALLPLVIAAGLPACPDSDPALPPIEPVGKIGGGLPSLTMACLGEGPDVTLSGLRGTPMVINIWASWCPPCIVEMPLLDAVAEEYDGDLLVLGVDMQDRPGSALDVAAALGLGFASVVDPPGDVRAAMNVPGPPVTFFVSADGVITGRHDGRIPDAASLDRMLQEYLGIGS